MSVVVHGFEVGEILYHGARFALWRAVRKADGRAVAIKAPWQSPPSAAHLRELELEQQLLRELPDDVAPRPIEILSAGSSVALVEELPPGKPLSALLEDGLDARAVIRVALALCRALGALHDRRIVHNDLRPDGVWIERETWRATFVDLTSALHPRRRPGDQPLPLEARDLKRVAPEQTGRVACLVDHRADLYALGLVLYEALWGALPFHSDDPMELIHSHLAMPPPAPPEGRIPEALVRITLKLLAKSPGQRYRGTFGVAADLRASLDSLERGGAPAPPAVGQIDRSPRPEPPSRLVDRTEVLRTLRGALPDVSGRRAALEVLEGPFGIGKTRLVIDAFSGAAAPACRLLIGKRDRVGEEAPYGGLILACRELARQLLTEPDSIVAEWRRRLHEENPGAGAVISQMIPDFRRLLGEGEPLPPADPIESGYRVQHAFRSLLLPFARSDRPLVVFLDDLAPRDVDTLSLIVGLLEDADVRSLLFVIAWRGEEREGVGGLSSQLGDVRESGAVVDEMTLGALREDDIAQLVGVMLDMDAAEVRPLCAAVLEKTQGNPYFAIDFIHRLHEQGLLVFDSSTGRWSWALREIQACEVTENVREALSRRIETLPEDLRDLLSAAACAGSEFEERLVAAALGRPSEDVAAGMLVLLGQGLLSALDTEGERAQRAGERRFRFVHDSIQEAAYHRLPDARRAALHLAIGEQLVGSQGGEVADAQLYEVLRHLNRGLDGISGEDRRLELARLNLRAARRARAEAAVERAHSYVAMAERLLPADPWRGDYETAFAVHLTKAECTYLSGQVEEAERCFDVTLRHARTKLDKAEVYQAQAMVLTHQDRNERAIEAALAGLRLFGVEIPANPSGIALPGPLLEATFRMSRLGREGLLGLPPMHDPEQRMAMRLLMRLLAPADRLGRKELNALCALKMLSLSLRHGNALESPVAYASFAIAVASMLGLTKLGYNMGRDAVALARRSGNQGILCRVLVSYGGWLCHLHEHINNSINYLEEAFRLSLGSGELIHGSYANGGLLTMMVSSGHAIPLVYERARAAMEFARRIRRWQSAGSVRVIMRWAETLGPYEPSAASPQEDALSSQGDEDWPAMLADMVDVQVAFLLGDLSRASRSAEAVLRKPGILKLSSCFREFFTLYHALTMAALAGSAPAPASSRRVVREAAAYFDRIAARCPANGVHRALLVGAELARIEGRHREANALYDEASAAAARNGFGHEEALAHELAARFHLDADRQALARFHLQRARDGYADWGARAKVAQLDADSLLQSVAAPPEAPPSRRAAPSLDFSSMLKASRAISSEIVLEQLLARLMRILIENAGATKGLLLMVQDGEPMIVAEGEVGAQVRTLPAARVEGDPRLCAAIVKYSARTGESVVLADAAEGPFAADPYIVSNRPKSILAAPLFNQGRLIALAYLENRLTAGAFTVERLEVVTVLLTQAALSIHNATLYAELIASHKALEEYNRTLEQKVEERTRQLRDMQQQLVQQEKLASLGVLTAGIAHELKNPLNFVNNFSELSRGLITEIAEGIRAQKERGDAAAVEDVQNALALLSQNVQKINEHGRRANRIIDGMLLHARGKASRREPADINTLIAESVRAAALDARNRDPSFEIHVDAIYDRGVGLVEISPQDISRVIVNLANNACYATRQKLLRSGDGYTPTLTVRVRDAGDQVEVRVRDNGTGIPAEIAGKIPTPFFTTKPPGEGTGLGLSISQDIIVQGHGGGMRIESAPGEFTEVIVTLPKHAAAHA